MLNKFLLQPFTDVSFKRSSNGTSIFELDGLRGLAVLIVLASHTSAFGMYGQGSLGVLLFFYLSGYVLTLPFLERPERIREKKVFLQYCLNRVLRIVPIYWLACLIIYLYTSSSNEWLLWNMSFIRGWGHFWSVAEEVRFYILFPLVILSLSYVKKELLRICLMLGLIYFFYEIKDLHKIDMMDGRKVSFYFWMFLGGVLSCHISRATSFYRFFQSQIIKMMMVSISAFSVVFIFFSSKYYFDVLWRPIFSFIPKGYSMNGWREPEIWFLLFFILFTSLSVYKGNLLNRLFTCTFLRHIGLLSYSIYLFHMNIMFVLAAKGFKYEGLFFSVFLIAYTMAYLSYILVEKPFLGLKKIVKR